MTAGGTYRGPRAGEAVGAAAELNALPVGSVLRLAGGLVADKIHHEEDRVPKWAICGYYGPHPIRDTDLPATVLFRPDAPQPATTDDAVERAARAWHEAANDDDADNYAVLAWEDLPADLHAIATRRMALALAAAGAGEAVDREVLVGQALAETVPDGAMDDDTFDRVKAAVLDVLAARGDAAPTEVEWGVGGQHGANPWIAPDEQMARRAAHPPAHPVVQRTVSAWREVTDRGGL